MGRRREYKVVTFHYADSVILCSEWHEYTDEEREQNGTLDRYSVIHGVSVTFRDGKAYIMPPAFRAGRAMLSAPTRRCSFLSPMKISDTKRLVRWHEPFFITKRIHIC